MLQKFQKKLYQFQQEFSILECDVKNDPIGHLEWKSDKKIRLPLPVLLGIRLYPKPSDSLRLRNPALQPT